MLADQGLGEVGDTFTGPAGTYCQTSEPTKPQRDILTALDLPVPKKLIELTTTR